jgi:hypothetical protein
MIGSIFKISAVSAIALLATTSVAAQTLGKEPRIYLFEEDISLGAGEQWSSDVRSDGRCGEDVWVFNKRSDGNNIFTHYYNLRIPGEVGRVSKGVIKTRQSHSNEYSGIYPAIFSEVKVYSYRPGSKSRFLIGAEPNQSFSFKAVSAASRIAYIYEFTLGDKQYETCWTKH